MIKIFYQKCILNGDDPRGIFYSTFLAAPSKKKVLLAESKASDGANVVVYVSIKRVH